MTSNGPHLCYGLSTSLSCVLVLLTSISFTSAKLWSAHELLTTRFRHASSQDLFVDVCKAAGYLHDVALTTREVDDYKRLGNEMFADTIPQENKRRQSRAATAKPERIWPHAVIPYEIQHNFSGEHKTLFKKAMRHWENFTCVTFIERSDEDKDYIVFTTADCGCCSYVGRRGEGPQAISIGKNCDKFGSVEGNCSVLYIPVVSMMKEPYLTIVNFRIVVHELGHVVGFWHEHTRPDRDQFVDIYYKNIQQGQDYNFEKLKGDEVNSLGQPYDYASIMHYARDTFARAMFMDTILPKPDQISQERPEIGQRIRLSPGDISQTNLLYRCPKCGSGLQDPRGSFSSPSFHAESATPASANSFCQWRITASHGERISLNVSTVDLPFSLDCGGADYLVVRDGHFINSPLIGKYCGTKTEVILSTGPRLWIEFSYSDTTKKNSALRGGHYRGFAASYEVVCGGDISGDMGLLQSPSYPNEYRPNKACVWRLSVPDNYQVALVFESFEIENHDDCIYDYLEVRDGNNESSPLIGRFCGYNPPSDLKSTGNRMWLKFVSDASVEKGGFALRYIKEFDECRTSNHGCAHRCVNTLGSFRCECDIGYELHSDGRRCEDACGGYIKANNGTLTSPNFPSLYPPRKRCIWEIEAHPQYRISINFTHFDMEGNNHHCEYDSVGVTSVDGAGGTAKDHGRFCGSVEDPFIITSETNHIRLVFTSDTSVQKTGFAAVFFTDRDECDVGNGGCDQSCKNVIGSYVCSCEAGFILAEDGHHCKEGGCKFELNSPYGQVGSPNYPDEYPSKKKCVWHFVTTPGHRISLNFHEFEIEPHQDCNYDKLQLYDGSSVSAPLMGTYCGPKAPEKALTNGNELFMYFESDGSVQRRGFKLRYTSVCGGHLSAGSHLGYIYSHAQYGGSHYDNKAECDWTITAPDGHSIFLRFANFQLEDEPHCEYDYVEIYDGYDDSSPKRGRFCGDKAPQATLSSGEALLLRFRTDDTINSKGFLAEYLLASPTDVDLVGSELEETTVRRPLEPIVND